MTTFETIFLVLLIIVVLLQIIILVSGAVSRHSISEIGQLKTMLDDSEKRICDEIEDLQQGNKAIEELARSELGLIKPTETFYRVIEKDDKAESKK